MNESEFELQLRGLRPARPSLELEERIDRELAPLQTSRAPTGSLDAPAWWERLLPGLGWAAVGAAAAVITMLSLNLAKGGPEAKPSGSAASVPSPATHPADEGPAGSNSGSDANSTARSAVTDNGILEATNEGLWEGGTTGVGRRVRYSTVERRSWTEANGAVTVVEVPREDVVVVPVSFQ